MSAQVRTGAKQNEIARNKISVAPCLSPLMPRANDTPGRRSLASSSPRPPRYMPARTLLTHPALPAFLRAMPAVVAVLTSVTRVGAGARCGEQIERDFAHEKD